jgi:diguanylate cyclase (GGDEF)-like protein
MAHVIFLSLFWFLGATELACVNVLSIAIYATCVWLVRRQPFLTEALMGIEIVVHGLIAVHLIGWQSGFHFYIMLIVPIALVSGGLSKRDDLLTRWVGGLGAGLLYLYMDATMRDVTPMHVLPVSVLNGLRTFNLAGTFVILGLLALVYRQLILQAESVLRHQACTDPLTQLQNRRSVLDVIAHEVAAFQRQGRSMVVIVADVDHFKSINDKHGHHCGDLVLQSLAKVLQAGVRSMDHVARWGGEEFLVVLPSTDLAEARIVAERLRASVAAQVCHSAKGPIPVTMTLGMAQLHEGESVEQLISRADQALYQGKQDGRNRVVVAEAVAKTPGH